MIVASFVVAVLALVVSVVVAALQVRQTSRTQLVQDRLAAIEMDRRLDERSPILTARFDRRSGTSRHGVRSRILLTNDGAEDYDRVVVRLVGGPELVAGLYGADEEGRLDVGGLAMGLTVDLGLIEKPQTYQGGTVRLRVTCTVANDSWDAIVQCEVSGYVRVSTYRTSPRR